MNKDILNLLGLCSRSGNIATGDILIKNIRKRSVYFVIIASDASENTKKKISDKCKFYNINYIIEGTSFELSKAIGKENRMAVGITNRGFTKKLKEKIGG
ncbi:MAG: ribosomal L7Ae/L30e/S12e/Gadd45 family protein [Thomasclavelia sp.]|nr:ribosomal L7Ae/L30e/S12e/Gadd45 family protein [Thomasclavelia sp.]